MANLNFKGVVRISIQSLYADRMWEFHATVARSGLW